MLPTERSKPNNCQHASLLREGGFQACSYNPYFIWICLICRRLLVIPCETGEFPSSSADANSVLSQGKGKGKGKTAETAASGTCLLDYKLESALFVFYSFKIPSCHPQKTTAAAPHLKGYQWEKYPDIFQPPPHIWASSVTFGLKKLELSTLEKIPSP